MRYRQLGQWGIKVSEVSLGTWLTFGRAFDARAAIAHTRRAFELGVNLFDTADEYQRGLAEELLGEALASLPREEYLVATKVFQPVGESPLQRGLSRKHIMTQVDASLRRLGTDYVDIYQCHRYDVDTPVEETARTMDDLVAQGKILYWGVSEWPAGELEHVVDLCRSHGWAVPVSNQPQYSLLWRKPEETVLPTCTKVGMGVLAWAPLAMGVLTGKYRAGAGSPDDARRSGSDGHFLDRYFKPGVLEAVEQVRGLADQAGVTPAQLSLAWCLRQGSVSSVIVGVSRQSQLEENIAAADMTLDPDLLGEADDIFRPVKVG